MKDFNTNANNRLCNKCAMTDVGNILSLGGELERGLKHELKDIEPLTRISNAHIHSQRTAPSAQSADRVTRIATALRFPLSPTREGNFHYFLTLNQIINRSCPIQINISKNIQYNSGSKEIIVICRSYSQH